MRKIAIGFAVVVMGLTIFFTWKALCSPNNQSMLGIGSFIILSLTLIVLIWYAYDTNSIARITRDRWAREGVLSTTYNIQLIGQKGDAGRTLFQLNNPSTLVVTARVNCNFKVYGQPVSAGRAYDGTDTWSLFPRQMSQGWFEIATLLNLKGKSIATMIAESTDANSEEQLSMTLELEFWDELGVNRKLPKRQHYFDFRRWAWIPHLTQR